MQFCDNVQIASLKIWAAINPKYVISYETKRPIRVIWQLTHTHTRTHKYVYVCVCACVCVCVCVCIYIYIYTHTHTRGIETRIKFKKVKGIF